MDVIDKAVTDTLTAASTESAPPQEQEPQATAAPTGEGASQIAEPADDQDFEGSLESLAAKTDLPAEYRSRVEGLVKANAKRGREFADARRKNEQYEAALGEVRERAARTEDQLSRLIHAVQSGQIAPPQQQQAKELPAFLRAETYAEADTTTEEGRVQFAAALLQAMQSVVTESLTGSETKRQESDRKRAEAWQANRVQAAQAAKSTEIRGHVAKSIDNAATKYRLSEDDKSIINGAIQNYVLDRNTEYERVLRSQGQAAATTFENSFFTANAIEEVISKASKRLASHSIAAPAPVPQKSINLPPNGAVSVHQQGPPSISELIARAVAETLPRA